MIISGEVGVVKPDPKIFALTVEKLGVQAGEAIFVDDMADNVKGAEQAGLHAILFRSSQQVRDEIEQLVKAA
jgi:HAD superfamily hydrolase (TIGR01509 family)